MLLYRIVAFRPGKSDLNSISTIVAGRDCFLSPNELTALSIILQLHGPEVYGF
jgi:hypothetical protein